MLVFFFVLFLLVVYVFSLGSRVKKIEEELFLKKPAKITSEDQKEIQTQKKLSGVVATHASESIDSDIKEYVQPSQSDLFDRFASWFKEDWLLKLGVILFLIGLGWFVSYAFLNNWIGPIGRITFGILVGSLILLFGFFRSHKYLHQGGVFMIFGASVVIMTLYAARVIYNFFNPISVLLMMFTTCVFIALSSIKHKVTWLSYASVILSSALPLFVHSPVNNYVGLFTYLLIVIVGSVWVALVSNARGVLVAALIAVSIYSFPHLTYLAIDRQILLLYAYLFSAIFFIFSVLGLLRTDTEVSRVDIAISVGNGLFLLAWVMNAASADWRSIIISSWMIVFLVGSFLVYRKTQKKESFYALSSVALAMLAAAFSAELRGPSLTIALTIEAALVPLLNYQITGDLKTTKILCLLFIVPGFISLQSINAYEWSRGIMHGHFFVIFILAIALMSLGFRLRQIVLQLKDESRYVHRTLLIVGSLYFYMLVWLVLHSGGELKDFATTLALVFYTLVGLVKYFYGKFNNSKVFLIYGGFTLGGVVIRLLLVDVWRLALTGRIITFLLIGILFIGTAFLKRPEKNYKES